MMSITSSHRLGPIPNSSGADPGTGGMWGLGDIQGVS